MALFRVNTGMREQEVVNLRWQSTSPEKPRKVTIAGLSHLFLAGPASCGIMVRHGVESAGVNAKSENLSCFRLVVYHWRDYVTSRIAGDLGVTVLFDRSPSPR
jgi:hypothetical protein